MASHDYAVLLAGGQGSRFWPQSRTLEPKQFLSLHQDKSLFEQTILRILPLMPGQNIFIATSELYRSQICEILKPYRIPQENIIYEPDGRNTAPSIGVCAALIHRRDPHSRIAVLPCDHLIKNKKRFLQLLRKALALCDRNIVILGIPPTRPATGYGYIQRGKGMSVKRFTEKPCLTTARRFVSSGDYYWNGGIFVGSSAVFLRAFREHLPQIYRLFPAIGRPADISGVWKKMPSISFDYGILEKNRDLIMISASGLGWSDLGSWQAWDELLPRDKQGNVMKADVVNIDSRNITVVGSSRLIATIGLDNLVIVDTPDALLVTRKDRTEEVKKVVDSLKAARRQEHYVHKTARRPWGSYTVLDTGDGFKVKQVEVKPGCALSLQYHKKRSEHWVVVEGTAKIVRGGKSFIFGANESTYIPVGCKHRLCNPSKNQVLKIIEVQAGRYLEEDDIVRLKDDFGRK
ncbi:MAG TPA: mannose-1-phosphate guanylyltransferase/mannose-6-phosphate isomerase [Candidatus Omnitrophota bacterium]|nr:mannose-1-phosphate guanylyltransferase/mannose-6-phosphate isomerase [Candidatus Omnitrophota bacterium]